MIKHTWSNSLNNIWYIGALSNQHMLADNHHYFNKLITCQAFDCKNWRNDIIFEVEVVLVVLGPTERWGKELVNGTKKCWLYKDILLIRRNPILLVWRSAKIQRKLLGNPNTILTLGVVLTINWIAIRSNGYYLNIMKTDASHIKMHHYERQCNNVI